MPYKGVRGNGAAAGWLIQLTRHGCLSLAPIHRYQFFLVDVAFISEIRDEIIVLTDMKGDNDTFPFFKGMVGEF